jgi:hypothetical protein
MKGRSERFPEEREHFLEHGYTLVPECFAREVARDWTSNLFERAGADPADPATWPEYSHLAPTRATTLPQLAPRAWEVVLTLMGGEESVEQPLTEGDSFLVNFRWRPKLDRPPSQLGTWHKDTRDGLDFFDAPSPGLVLLLLWSDISPRGGGTHLVTDSIAPVARHLLAHPEGVVNNGEVDPFGPLGFGCSRFVELTGRAGDVAILHPFLLHGRSGNYSGRPRIITNPHATFRAPLDFTAGGRSLVERAILRALGRSPR